MWRILLFIPLLCTSLLQAQNNTAKDTLWKKTYRASERKINNLVHTRLDLRPDMEKETLNGQAWITLKPVFYPSDSLLLDAKDMSIRQVQLVKPGSMQPLKYTYADGLHLRIQLDKTYSAAETYTVYIAYTAKMGRVEHADETRPFTGKGLQYSRPENGKGGVQLWTQGETEFNSCWFPTIDKPNQRSTSEIALTVPAYMVTLSNGVLAAKKQNSDNTRTDTWKNTQSNPPYLFFIGAGDYAVVKEKYRNIDLEYYVDKEYKNEAAGIFRNTPAIIGFFSDKLGVNYAWSRYAQIACRGLIASAMENTTAVSFSDRVQKNRRELLDDNEWESVVAHEIMHHWFGNMVTPESWSNLALSEGLATYGEYLWYEHKYGRQKADEHYYQITRDYLGDQRNITKQVVRYTYRDKEGLFDAVSYQKAACVFHMLRNEVGDEAFFKSLKLYLEQNKFKSVEAASLRLAFEEVTGRDLAQFWNQWFYGAGHPQLDVAYSYAENNKMLVVTVKQLQKTETVFQAPLGLDIYEQGVKTTYPVMLTGRTDTFRFTLQRKPNLVNLDGKKVLLCEKQENKTLDDYIYQYGHSELYADKREAVEFALANAQNETAAGFLLELLGNAQTTPGIRHVILHAIDEANMTDEPILAVVEEMLGTEKNNINKSIALDILGKAGKKEYEKLFTGYVRDSSYSVSGAALEALLKINQQKAIALLPSVQSDCRGRLKKAAGKTEVFTKTDADFGTMLAGFSSQSLVDQYKENFVTLFNFITYLGLLQNPDNFKKGLETVIDFRTTVTPYSAELKDMITGALQEVKEKKKKILAASATPRPDIEAQLGYIEAAFR